MSGMLNAERAVDTSNGRAGRQGSSTACLEVHHGQKKDIAGNKEREGRSSITINFGTAIVLFAVIS